MYDLYTKESKCEDRNANQSFQFHHSHEVGEKMGEGF